MAELRSCVSESRGGRPGLPVPNSPNYGLSGRKATQNLNQTWQHRRIRHTYSTWGSCDQFLRLVQQNTDRTRPGRPRPRRLGARGVCGGGVGGVGGWGLGGGVELKLRHVDLSSAFNGVDPHQSTARTPPVANYSKQWFTTSFLQPPLYLVTP